MLRRDQPAMTVLLGALIAVAPLAMDIYLASMPSMTRALAATSEQVQLTLSLYMYGGDCRRSSPARSPTASAAGRFCWQGSASSSPRRSPAPWRATSIRSSAPASRRRSAWRRSRSCRAPSCATSTAARRRRACCR